MTNATPISQMDTQTLRGIDNARYAIDGLKRAWKRQDHLSEAYTEIVRLCLDEAEWLLAGGDYGGAQRAVERGWNEYEAGS